MSESAPRSRPRIRLVLSRGYPAGVFGAVALTLGSAAAFAIYKYAWTNGAVESKSPDASVLISTFITLYGVLVAAYGVLIGFVINIVDRPGVRMFGLVVIAEATLLDLFLLLNSTNDLYNSVIGKLTVFELHDDVHDFIGYFTLNAVATALILILVIACLPKRQTRSATANIDSGTGV